MGCKQRTNSRCKIFLFLIGLFILILLADFAFAGTCQPSQRIMRLYQATNSHGAVWNEASYTYDICFNEIFGYEYKGPEDHACHGLNKIINLYQSTNSHGEAPPGSYSQGICYGDLECRRTSDNCYSDEKILVRLFQATNSHISDSSDTNYPIKVCCKANTMNSAYWADMNNNPITNADLDDSVKLFAIGTNFKDLEITFDIYKKTGWLFKTSKKIATSSSKEFITWTANEPGEYYFTASVSGKKATSADLIVSSTPNNSPPVVKIENPKRGDIYIAADDIDFNQSSSDTDDFFNYTWNFGDGESAKGSSEDYINYNTSHRYSSAGQKNINLNVRDYRGLGDYEALSFLIVSYLDGKYVLGNIVKPRWNEKIPIEYEFSAVGSYAVEVRDRRVYCLGGACPWSIPNGDSEIIINDPDSKRGKYDMFNFTWEFDNNPAHKQTIEKNYVYKTSFSYFGNHIVNLTVRLNSGGESKVFTKFVVAPLGPLSDYCVNNGQYWYENGIFYETTQPNGKCTKGDSDLNTQCCPANVNGIRYTCAGPAGTETCSLDLSKPCPKTCENYTNLPDCNADINLCRTGSKAANCGRVINDACSEQNIIILPQDDCRCKWDPTAKGGAGACYQATKLKGNILEIDLFDSNCLQSVQTGECDDDEMMAQYSGDMQWNSSTIDAVKARFSLTEDRAKTWLNENCPNLCFSGSKVLLCGQEGLKLGFFNWMNIIVAIIIIVIVYICFNVMKKKRRKKSKH